MNSHSNSAHAQRFPAPLEFFGPFSTRFSPVASGFLINYAKPRIYVNSAKPFCEICAIPIPRGSICAPCSGWQPVLNAAEAAAGTIR